MHRSRLALLACLLFTAVAIPVTLADAAGNPSVTTSAASAVGDTSATLNGSVNPNSIATQYAFQYGPTSSYGEETALTSAGSGASPVNVAAALSGLAPGGTYHFRIIAISSSGTSVGGDQSFSSTGTAPAPSPGPSATTGSASAVGQAGASLSGTFNPNGQQTTYYFEYGPTINYGYETSPQTAAASTSSTPASATLSGLPAGTTYHFRLVALNPGGVTVGSDGSFTTTTPPAVTSAPGTDITNDAAVLNGSVNPESIATTYYFEYGASTSYGLQTPPQSAGSGSDPVGVNAEVTGLEPNTTYHFRLVATSAGGTTYGDDQTAVTSGAPTSGSVVALIGRMGFVSPGNVIGVEIGCFGPSQCAGTFKLTVGSTTIGSGTFKVAGGSGGFHNIQLNAAGQKDMKRNSVNHLLLAGVTITTSTGQTINGRLSLARWLWKNG